MPPEAPPPAFIGANARSTATGLLILLAALWGLALLNRALGADSWFVRLKDWIVGQGAGLSPTLQMLLSALVVIVGIATFGHVAMAFSTWLERKVIGRMQNRYGPNRVGIEFIERIPGLKGAWGLLTKIPVIGPRLARGIYGLGQPIADGIKMITKEDIVPKDADPVIHFLAPVVVVVPAFLVWAVIPFGRDMIGADLDIGVLFFLAVSAAGTLAIFMAGWGSRNKFSLLGAMRAVAQMVSYEVPMVLGVVPVVMFTGSLATSEIASAQSGGLLDITHWFVWSPWGGVGFLAFLMAGVSECNRTPFDIPEAESEIIAGFHTEYSGFKFALFMLAEFVAAWAISALATTLFLGAWNGPAFLPSWFWFVAKTATLVFFMIWLRATFPRLRVDQLMGFGWKFLLPLTLANVLAAGVHQFLTRGDRNTFFWGAVAWVVTGAVLYGTYAVLARVGAGGAIERRKYRYADELARPAGAGAAPLAAPVGR